MPPSYNAFKTCERTIYHPDSLSNFKIVYVWRYDEDVFFLRLTQDTKILNLIIRNYERFLRPIMMPIVIEAKIVEIFLIVGIRLGNLLSGMYKEDIGKTTHRLANHLPIFVFLFYN